MSFGVIRFSLALSLEDILKLNGGEDVLTPATLSSRLVSSILTFELSHILTFAVCDLSEVSIFYYYSNEYGLKTLPALAGVAIALIAVVAIKFRLKK